MCAEGATGEADEKDDSCESGERCLVAAYDSADMAGGANEVVFSFRPWRRIPGPSFIVFGGFHDQRRCLRAQVTVSG